MQGVKGDPVLYFFGNWRGRLTPGRVACRTWLYMDKMERKNDLDSKNFNDTSTFFLVLHQAKKEWLICLFHFIYLLAGWPGDARVNVHSSHDVMSSEMGDYHFATYEIQDMLGMYQYIINPCTSVWNEFSFITQAKKINIHFLYSN